MQRRIIPGVIDGQQALCTLPPRASALEAAELMEERGIGAVLVVDHGVLQGIVTERDIVYRLVAKNGVAESTDLGSIMTSEPETLTPEDTALAAFEKMRAGRYRHLPVLRGEELCGMVSIRDLYEALRQSLQEDLDSAESLIYGEQYGASA